MKVVVSKNHLVGQILYRNLEPSKKTASKVSYYEEVNSYSKCKESVELLTGQDYLKQKVTQYLADGKREVLESVIPMLDKENLSDTDLVCDVIERLRLDGAVKYSAEIADRMWQTSPDERFKGGV